jgi:hypothetical protein
MRVMETHVGCRQYSRAAHARDMNPLARLYPAMLGYVPNRADRGP